MTIVNLEKYFARVNLVGLKVPCATDRDTLKRVMEAQSNAIPFENIDVVQNKLISMDVEAVQKKLVDEVRGGYCFEQNTLLKAVLEEMGYSVEPLLCRVRWLKKDDSDGPNTTFTHLALK
ncbi:MAG: hypothetical protein SGBAC_007041, partial [Bacillariaceae sp.]